MRILWKKLNQGGLRSSYIVSVRSRTRYSSFDQILPTNRLTNSLSSFESFCKIHRTSRGCSGPPNAPGAPDAKPAKLWLNKVRDTGRLE